MWLCIKLNSIVFAVHRILLRKQQGLITLGINSFPVQVLSFPHTLYESITFLSSQSWQIRLFKMNIHNICIGLHLVELGLHLKLIEGVFDYHAYQ